MVKTPKADDLTPYLSVPARIYNHLKDGQPHSKYELHRYIAKQDTDLDDALKVHISSIRKTLPPEYEIVVVWIRRRLYYRLIRSACLLN